MLKYLKSLLLFALLLAFQAKGNTGYYPGTVLLHLDSIDNKLFKEQCSEERFYAIVYDFNYTLIRSLIPLEDARAYLKFLRTCIVLRPEFGKYTYLVDLAESSLLHLCKDVQKFNKHHQSVKEKWLNQATLGYFLEYELGLGNFLVFNGDRELALKSYRNVEGIIENNGFKNLENNSKILAIVNANALAVCFRELYLLDSAEFYFKLGLQRANLLNRADWQGIISGNLAEFQIRNGHTEFAEELLITDYKQSLKTNQIGSAINALLTLIDLYILNQNFAKANQTYDTASQLISRVEPTFNDGLPEFKNGLLLRAIKLGLVKGTSTEALRYLDSLYQIVRKEKNKETHSDRYVIEDNLSKLVSLREERKRISYIIIAFSLLMILAIIMAFLQRRYNQILTQKNDEIKQQSKNLERLNQQKSKLFSVVAHDIRGPIGSLQGLLELYAEKQISELELMEYSQGIGDNLNSLNTMLDNLLNWARTGMENGIVPSFSEIDLGECCQEIITHVSPQLAKKNLLLHFQSTEKIWVQTDPALLTVIIRNLLHNAIKFSEPNTPIHLVLSANQEAKRVDISIADKGQGMSQESLNQILHANTGVISKPGTQGERGTGLGLMLCKEFTLALKGTFSGKSTPGIGTTFTVSLPLG